VQGLVELKLSDKEFSLYTAKEAQLFTIRITV